MRKLAVLLAFMFTLVAVPTASAEIDSVFAGKIDCVTQGNGQRHCAGPGGATNAHLATVRSFDNTPIDVNVGFPDAAEFGNGPYPMAMYFHGFGGAKEGFGGDLQRFLNQGIAVFSMTDRGFRNSCGSDGWSGRPATYNPNNDAVSALQANGEDCSKGFIHLMDTRHEVRDAQYLVSILADEGLILPKKIGTVGASYGGGKSMALASLKNRIMKTDGTYAPWESPGGLDMEIAAAAPIVPWTDFAYSLLPNGRTLDYAKDAPYGKPFGVMKSGIISALLPSGDSFSGELRTEPQPPLGDLNAEKYPVDPNFDILGWKALMEQGEPYGGTPTAELMFDEMTSHHSSYYIDDTVEPAPLLIAQGFADDLFPIDEPLRYYNRTKSNFPDADISLLFADIGHPRAPLSEGFSQGRPEDIEMGYQRVDAWFSHYLLSGADQGPKPPNRVEVRTQKCPYSEPSVGFDAATWPAMSPGELRLADPATKVIESDSGLPDPAFKFSTLNEACGRMAATTEPGTLEYDFGTVPAGGVTLMGAPTVVADISVANGAESQIAARLFEISGGQERLISRGLYRPDESGYQVFQLHGNGYKFEAGTSIRLQLLSKDGVVGLGLASYARPSNDQQDITVKDLEVRLPVMEQPGSGDGMVKEPQPKILPAGVELAGDYSAIGSVTIDEWANRNEIPDPDVVGNLTLVGAPKVKGKLLTAKMTCKIGNDSCKASTLIIKGAPKKGKKGKKLLVVKKGGLKANPGQTKTFRIKLTSKARKFFKDSKVRKRGKKKTVRGPKTLRSKVIVNNKFYGYTTVKRVGKVK